LVRWKVSVACVISAAVINGGRMKPRVTRTTPRLHQIYVRAHAPPSHVTNVA